MSLHWFDVAAVLLLLAFVLFSARRGLVKEFASVCSWVAAYYGAVYLYPFVAPFFGMIFKTGILAGLASFLTAFIAIFIAVRFIGFSIRRKLHLKKTSLALDRGAGSIFGGIKCMLFFFIILYPLNFFPAAKTKLQNESMIASLLMKLSYEAVDVMETDLKYSPQNLKNKLERAGEYINIPSANQNGGNKKTVGIPLEELTSEDRKQMEELLRSIK
ncbi:MAG: hypothetical protein IEMM0002_0936 [bacterium]|nr:MAG: hypothetical protein IEMM0002_0936 [bacterium]